PGLLRVQRRQGLDAVHRSHAQIDEREVESLRCRDVERAARLTHGGDVEAHRPEAHGEHLEDRRVVVDDQNFPGHWSEGPATGALRGWRAVGTARLRSTNPPRTKGPATGALRGWRAVGTARLRSTNPPRPKGPAAGALRGGRAARSGRLRARYPPRTDGPGT